LLGNQGGFCSEMARYQLSSGGKRLRALVPLWVYERLGRDPIEAIPLGCAVELVHNATLVHDDLQDGDVLRRGKPTVWKHWSPAQAINSGDALFQLAFIVAAGAKTERLPSVLERLARGTLSVIEGQAQEFLMKEEPYPVLERYLGVVRGKTAALFATAVGMPLLALARPEQEIAQAEDAALKAGIVFQLQDDLLDLYGAKGRERRGTDIAEGKVSSLIAWVNARDRGRDRERLAELLGQPRDLTSDADIGEAIAILERQGAREGVMHEIASIRRSLEGHPLASTSPALHSLLVELAGKFLEPLARA
ncbi:MAG TPA: polyprenyl synthetase family protein, partial [Bdellovibrionota bacterium]|nr:polyprenyl synthetase family protein [Bdellovibrionota bacterium]